MFPAMTLTEQLVTQASLLPDPLLREALDFVLFLRHRHERGEDRDLVHAQSVVLGETWDNDEDEIWNDV